MTIRLTANEMRTLAQLAEQNGLSEEKTFFTDMAKSLEAYHDPSMAAPFSDRELKLHLSSFPLSEQIPNKLHAFVDISKLPTR